VSGAQAEWPALPWVPEVIRLDLESLQLAYTELARELGRSLRDSELASRTGLSRGAAREVLASLSRTGTSAARASEPASGGDDVRPSDRPQVREVLRRMLDALTPAERAVLVLSHAESMSTTEIGALLDLPEERVRELHGTSLLGVRALLALARMDGSGKLGA